MNKGIFENNSNPKISTLNIFKKKFYLKICLNNNFTSSETSDYLIFNGLH